MVCRFLFAPTREIPRFWTQLETQTPAQRRRAPHRMSLPDSLC